MRIGDRQLVDGGILDDELDVAVEAGARLVVVVNPIVPYVNEARRGGRRRAISKMGFPQIGYSLKLMTYRRLHEIRAIWEERYPGVDFVLIEPDATDELMFARASWTTPPASRSRATLPLGDVKRAKDYPR